MKGIIKKGSMRCLSLAAACLISVSDAGYFGNTMNVCAVTQTQKSYKTWKQYDSRWGDLHLGKSGYTMRGSGCAATALSFLLMHAGNFSEDNFNPGIFCRLMSQFDGFGENGDILWPVVRQVAPGFRYVRTLYFDKENMNTYEEKYAAIEEFYNAGYYLIIDVQNSGHWVAVDRIENNRIISFDSGGDRDTDVFRQYDSEGSTCIKIFKSDYTTSAPPAVKYNYNTGIYVTTTELNIRKSPTSSSELMGKLNTGTRVDVRGISGCWGKIILNGAPAWICLEYTVPYSDKQSNTSEPVTTSPVTAAVTEPVTTTTVPVTTTVTKPVTTTTVPVTTTVTEPVTTTTVPVTTTVTKPVTTTTVPVTTTVTVMSAASGTVYKTGKYKTTDWLNYRKAPNTEAEVYGTLSPETALNITEISGNWGKTEYNGKVCWVCMDYTAAVAAAETTPQVTSVPEVTTVTEPVTTTVPVTTAVTTVTQPVTVKETSAQDNYILKCRTTAALNFREGAGTEYNVICVIPKDTELTVYSSDSGDRWGRVKYQNREGWVCLDYVVLNEDASEKTESSSVSPAVTEKTSSELVGTAAQGVAVIKPEPDSSGIIRGDVDRNGYINVLDYIMLRGVFEGKALSSSADEADVDGDGAVTIHDLLALRAMFIQR